MLREVKILAVSLVAVGLAAGCPAPDKCELDSECGDAVCARTGECLPAARVREVQVRWTVRGQAASAASCSDIEPLGLQFQASASDALKYEPVLCSAGLFTIDKLPTRMSQVRLDGVGVRALASIPATGQVMVDLR